MLKQMSVPKKYENTFHGLVILAIARIVITNDEYELMKSASCKPS
jgi:hypothetical protein